MQFHEVIRDRFSVRAYRSEPVAPEKLERVLEAARLAPTACNNQPFRLIVLHTETCRSALSRIYHSDWFTQAPLVIAACAVEAEGWSRKDGRNYAVVDTTIAFDHLILAAAAEGLGTCWVAAFDPPAAREILGLPPGVEPVAFTPLGYPAAEAPVKKRRPLEEIVYHNHWPTRTT